MDEEKGPLSLHLRFTVGTQGPFALEELHNTAELFSKAIIIAANECGLELYQISTEIKTPK